MWEMQPPIIIYMLNFHALVIFEDSTYASLSGGCSAAFPANVILFCLFTQ